MLVRHEVFGTLPACQEAPYGHEAGLGAARVAGQLRAGGTLRGRGPGRPALFGVRGAPVETVTLGGRAVGRTFRDHWTRHLLLGNVQPDDASRSKPEQARQAYENLEAALQVAGMDMSNVARTWLFIDDILAWYGPFNAVRTSFYQERGVFDRIMPASTGVGGPMPGAPPSSAGPGQSRL